jgi:Protein of unknown function (DUF3800)
VPAQAPGGRQVAAMASKTGRNDSVESISLSAIHIHSQVDVYRLPAPVGVPLRIYHVDDSGDGRNLIVFGALSLDVATYGEASRHWLEFRDELAEDPRLLIPATAALHAERLAGARGLHLHRSRSTDRATHRQHCQSVILRGLETIAKLPDVKVHAAYRHTHDYARDRPEVFAAFLQQIDSDLEAQGAYGVMIMDGNGTEHALRRALQNRPARGPRMLRDLVFRSARETQLLQAADMLAYATYQALAQRPNRRFMWDWSRVLPWADGPWAV